MRKEELKPKPWQEISASFKKNEWRSWLGVSEWCCEWVSYRLGNWAFLEVLEYLGKLSLLVALILWIYPGCKERNQASESAKEAAADARISRHYVAWQTINSALGKPGNGGRADALRDLSRDGISLDGISLTGGVVLIGPLLLTNASMAHADFSDGTYENINFSKSDFAMSKWDHATCRSCDFRGASFWAVTFKRTLFQLCDFGFVKEGTNQRNADFIMQFSGDERTRFEMCNFAHVESPLGVWNSVSFAWCNFAYSHLWDVAIGTNVDIFCCNLFGASTSSPELIKWAYHQQVTFTNIVSLDKWRHFITNGSPKYQTGGPEFMAWASNQFVANIKTNNPNAWLEWSRENLKD